MDERLEIFEDLGLVYCSTEGCDIIVDNKDHGAKTPHRCSRCEYQNRLKIQRGSQRRMRANA